MARTKVVGGKSPSKKKSPAKKKAPEAGGVKKPHRFRPGTVALREVRRYQKGTELLIKRLPFRRLFKEILANSVECKVTAGSLVAMQEAVEAYVISWLADAQTMAIHAKRITVMPKDLKIARVIRSAGLVEGTTREDPRPSK